MTQKDRELLLKDLCARIPYGINCEYQGKVHGIVGFNHGKVTIYKHFKSEPKFPFIEEIKPYLFPLSSMTEKQKEEMDSFDPFKTEETKTLGGWAVCLVDFYNKHHFDYRGLIEKGLALDATALHIY